MCTIARKETVLNRMEKYIVYLRSEREAVRLRKVRQILLPQAVRILQFQYNGDKFRLRNRRGGGYVQRNENLFRSYL